MVNALAALFGAGFTVAVSLSLGALLLERLKLDLRRTEAGILSFIAGSACLSLSVFLLALVHQARQGVFAILGARGDRPGNLASAPRDQTAGTPALDLKWKWFFVLAYTAFLVIYFINALAPEASPDGSGYHLGNVVRMWKASGFDWGYRSMYSYLSQGLEMLFLFAFSFGRHSAAALMHFAFQAMLPVLILCYGRRIGEPRAAVFAAILTYASPVIGLCGSSAYTDVAVATLSFAVFYLLQVWDHNKTLNYLIIIGLLSGFAYAVKYTAFTLLPIACIFVWWRSRNGKASRPLGLLALAAPAAALAGPWLLRNWLWVKNPFAPFFNRLFPNPYYHAGMERIYMEQLRRYPGFLETWQIPLQLTMFGGHVGGTLGPVFLLAPLALLAFRTSQGRRLLAVGAVLALPAFLNSGARFLIPCLPFLALAMGIGMARTKGALPALALFQAIACWPAILSTYCDSWASRISEIPFAAAIRKEPEQSFLLRRIPELGIKPVIERMAPPGERIFSFTTMPEAYIDRTILVQYESALGNLANDALLTPVSNSNPTHREVFPLGPTVVRGVRVVQKADSPEFWSVAELKVFSQGRELKPLSKWRVTSSPNPFEAGLAVDGNPATRWSTWQAMSAGDRLQVEFGRAEEFDRVELQCGRAWDARVELEVLTEAGQWAAVPGAPLETDEPEPADLRRAATLALRERGIGFILVRDSDAPADDMRNSPGRWGLTEVGNSHGIRLYRIL